MKIKSQKIIPVLDGCFITVGLFIVAYLTIGFVIMLVVLVLLFLTGLIHNPLYSDLAFIGIYVGFYGAIVGAIATIPLYWVWKQHTRKLPAQPGS